MRILQVSNGYPPRAFGGVELHTRQLVGALSRSGHAVQVFTRHSDLGAADGTIVDEEIDGVPVRSVVNDSKAGGFEAHWQSAPVRQAFEALLDRERPDLVHVQHLIGLSHDLPVVARSRGIRVVATVHEYWYACARVMLLRPDGTLCRGPAHADCEACFLAGTIGDDPGPCLPPSPITSMRLALARHLPAGAARAALVPVGGGASARARFTAMARALACFERATTPSRFVVDELARHGLALPRATRVIPLGIDHTGLIKNSGHGGKGAEFRDEATDATNHTNVTDGSRKLALQSAPDATPTDKLRIVFIGHVLPHKGPHILLEAAALLPDARLEIHLHGRRWPEHPFERRIGPLLAADSRVHAEGAFAEGALPRLLAAADVVAVPSSCPESFGIAVREAHLAGRPVLCADRGALAEAVCDGIDGLLLPADDPLAWSRALRRLLEEPALLERLTKGARATAHTIPDMNDYAARLEEFLLR